MRSQVVQVKIGKGYVMRLGVEALQGILESYRFVFPLFRISCNMQMKCTPRDLSRANYAEPASEVAALRKGSHFRLMIIAVPALRQLPSPRDRNATLKVLALRRRVYARQDTNTGKLDIDGLITPTARQIQPTRVHS